MEKLKVTIEKGPDLFGAWADNVPGIYGEGETVQVPAAGLRDTGCQPQHCAASSSTGPGCGSPPTSAGTGRGTAAFRRSAAACLVAA